MLREELPHDAPSLLEGLSLLEELEFHFGPQGHWSPSKFPADSTEWLVDFATRLTRRYISTAALQSCFGTILRPTAIYG